jgi:signal transduction histidine kinase
VSQLRSAASLDIASALRALATSSRTLDVHVDVPDVLEIDRGAHADALLKCVQEIITNTTRHAGARNLWIRVESDAERVSCTRGTTGRRHFVCDRSWAHGHA